MQPATKRYGLGARSDMAADEDSGSNPLIGLKGVPVRTNLPRPMHRPGDDVARDGCQERDR